MLSLALDGFCRRFFDLSCRHNSFLGSKRIFPGRKKVIVGGEPGPAAAKDFCESELRFLRRRRLLLWCEGVGYAAGDLYGLAGQRGRRK
jgi:hypothetical protein